MVLDLQGDELRSEGTVRGRAVDTQVNVSEIRKWRLGEVAAPPHTPVHHDVLRTFRCDVEPPVPAGAKTTFRVSDRHTSVFCSVWKVRLLCVGHPEMFSLNNGSFCQAGRNSCLLFTFLLFVYFCDYLRIHKSRGRNRLCLLLSNIPLKRDKYRSGGDLLSLPPWKIPQMSRRFPGRSGISLNLLNISIRIRICFCSGRFFRERARISWLFLPSCFPLFSSSSLFPHLATILLHFYFEHHDKLVCHLFL